MSIVTLQFPEVKAHTPERPSHCPYCPGETFQRWGGAWREVRDPHVPQVFVYRYRCCLCHRTFRHYPPGISRSSQTERMRMLAAVCWLLGLSYRGLGMVCAAFGVAISRMSAWRDVQRRAKQLEAERFWKPVRVLGLDGAYVRGWGKTRAVLVAVDLGTGKPVTVGYVEEKDPQAVQRFLEPLLQRLGVSVIVTDDLSSFKQVADQFGLEHQVCQFHVRRWVGKTLHELKEGLPPEWQWAREEVKQLIHDLPIEGDKRLMVIYKQLPRTGLGRSGGINQGVDQLRVLISRLMENWGRFRVFDWQKDVPWTNNPTEQVIGKMKMRARTVRGYKTWPGMASGLMVSGMGVA